MRASLHDGGGRRIEARSHHRGDELTRLEGHARPQKDLVRAMTVAPDHRLATPPRLRREPELAKRVLAEIAERLMTFADADIAVGIDHAGEETRAAGDDLLLQLR